MTGGTMNPVALFESDAYLRECAAEVVETGTDGSRPWVVLSRTVLYPEGGGQPSDRGWIGDVLVTDVAKEAEAIRHFTAAPIAPGSVHVRLDWPRRYDHMQQHTGQHVLTAVAADRFGWPTTAFHLGSDVSDVELAVPSLSAAQLTALEEAVAEEVRAARPVASHVVTPEEYATLAGIRTRGLPDGHAGPVRLIEIAGLDRNTCGGTHVHSTAEIESIALLATEPMRGGTRVHFVAGGRVRRRLAAHEARNAELRTLVGAPDHELAGVVAARIADLRLAEKRLQITEEELAQALAHALVARPGVPAEAHLEERDLAFLQRVARAFVASAPDRAVFLTSSAPSGACFLLAAGPRCRVDAQQAGREVATLLEGRGGGTGGLFQGKAGTLLRRDDALALVRGAVEAP